MSAPVATVRERPILMSAPMVRAILAGTKTQTRRVVTPQPEYCDPLPSEPVLRGQFNTLCWMGENFGRNTRTLEFLAERCPYGNPGDMLWVRETWRVRADLDDVKPRDLAPCEPWYCATGNGHGDEEPSGCAGGLGKKRPGIYLPRWASRITLEVTEVRVEHLQEISEEDARAEGVEAYQPTEGDGGAQEGPAWNRIQYSHLWDSINGRRAPWASNPWVWAISFRRIEARP